MASVVDDAVVAQATGGIVTSTAAAHSRRIDRMDQLASDTATTGNTYLFSPGIMLAQGMRMLNGTPTQPPGNAPNTNTP